jgi:DNA (cytosine-5)-methyltransferase 1
MNAYLGQTAHLNSFFSGIGGFELAFERQGFSTQFYCENDPFCRSILKRHWPKLPHSSDILNLDPLAIPNATLWTAGFPCQDLSLAKVPHGRTGFRGAKSSLFFTFHKLLRIHRPQIVLLENVAGLLNSHKGSDFRILLESLTELNYAVAWRVLNARYFGVPQSRPRVFICAWMEDVGRAVSTLFESKLSPALKGEREGFLTPSYCSETGAIVPHISYCISATSARHTGLDWARSYVTYRHGVRRLTPLECERLQGFPDHWTLPANDCVSSLEGLDTERYKALGNAIAVPVVEWIANRVAFNLKSNSSDSEQTPLPISEVSSSMGRYLIGEFTRSRVRIDGLREVGEIRWQRGGLAYRDLVFHTSASTAPFRPICSRFVDVLEKQQLSERYFLSQNAARGIIRRVDRAGRHLFPPLDASLRALAFDETTRIPEYECGVKTREAVYI